MADACLLRDNFIQQGASAIKGSETAKAADKLDSDSAREGVEICLCHLQSEPPINIAIWPMKSCVAAVKSY